jgi:hypothetical protein
VNTSPHRFLRNLLVLDVILFALAAYPVHSFTGVEGVKALAVALLVTTANAFLGYRAVVRSLQAAMSQFMLTVFGGMMLRMGVMLMILAFVVLATELPQITFTIGLFFAYLCKSVLEMILIHNLSTNRRS